MKALKLLLGSRQLIIHGSYNIPYSCPLFFIGKWVFIIDNPSLLGVDWEQNSYSAVYSSVHKQLLSLEMLEAASQTGHFWAAVLSQRLSVHKAFPTTVSHTFSGRQFLRGLPSPRSIFNLSLYTYISRLFLTCFLPFNF